MNHRPIASPPSTRVDRPASNDISFVMPTRNSQHDVVARVESLLAQLETLGIGDAEVVVVDDGSHDGTCDRLHDLQTQRSRLRVLRHDRPRGMEAAGQTGLERATGNLVFIGESEQPIHTEDLRKLLKISEDLSVVAARAESKARPPSAALLRRLRAWGTNADQRIEPELDHGEEFCSVQMIRRPHLNTLASPMGGCYRLTSESAKSLDFNL